MHVDVETPLRKSDLDKPQILIGDLGVSIKNIELEDKGLLLRSATA